MELIPRSYFCYELNEVSRSAQESYLQVPTPNEVGVGKCPDLQSKGMFPTPDLHWGASVGVNFPKKCLLGIPWMSRSAQKNHIFQPSLFMRIGESIYEKKNIC